MIHAIDGNGFDDDFRSAMFTDFKNPRNKIARPENQKIDAVICGKIPKKLTPHQLHRQLCSVFFVCLVRFPFLDDCCIGLVLRSSFQQNNFIVMKIK